MRKLSCAAPPAAHLRASALACVCCTHARAQPRAAQYIPRHAGTSKVGQHHKRCCLTLKGDRQLSCSVRHGSLSLSVCDASGPRQMRGAARTCGRTRICPCSAAPDARVCSGPDRAPVSRHLPQQRQGVRQTRQARRQTGLRRAHMQHKLHARDAGATRGTVDLQGQRAAGRAADWWPDTVSPSHLVPKRTSNLVATPRQRPPYTAQNVELLRNMP